MRRHIQKITAKLIQENLDGLLVSIEANNSYAAGFQSRDAYALICSPKSYYFTDSRYTEEAINKICPGFKVKEYNGSFYKVIAAAAIKAGLKRIGFEERHLPYAEFRMIKKFLGRKAKLLPTHGIIEELRAIKDKDDLAKIRRATRITVKALKFAEKMIAPGMTEIEAVGELERFLGKNGATGSAFDIIVAGGPNSAYPHHIPTSRKIRNNEPVLVDLGADFYGYKSDLTRVFFLGKITVLARKVYDIVRHAQELALRQVRPGRKIGAIDLSARGYIDKAGYGSYFSHSLGHGVGLAIHEAPSISAQNSDKLKPGQVFTIEPAIYLPGKFGIRIEDIVTVTEKGCEVLSGSLHK